MGAPAERVPGLANGQQIAGSDRTVMGPGVNRTEFESVVLDEDGTAYLVSALVSARPLTGAATVLAQEAVAFDESPILAVRANQVQGQPIVESGAPPVEPGEHLRALGARALANEPPK